MTHDFEPVNPGSRTCGVCGTDRASREHVARRPRAARAATPRLTLRVLRGLSLLTTHAEAGGPDDLEIDVSTPEGQQEWADVERAIAWALEARHAVGSEAKT